MKTKEQNLIYLGEFPQTLKDENVTITDVIDDRGYYLGSDNSYYAKVVADPFLYFSMKKIDRSLLPEKERETYRLLEKEFIFDLHGDKIVFPELDLIQKQKLRYIPNIDSYRFNNGTPIIPQNEYYFKVEPIKWNVIVNQINRIYLLSDKILDTPFSVLGELFPIFYKKIKMQESYKPTGDVVSKTLHQLRSMPNTEKVKYWYDMKFVNSVINNLDFKLVESFKLLSSSELDLINNTTIKKPTDYALVNGVQIHGKYYGDACQWWLDGCTHMVYFDGKERKCNFNANDYGHLGIAPAIWKKIEK